jgi:hypothetical protein
MPISVSQLANNTASVTIPVDKENTVTVVYRPGSVTEKTFAELSALEAMDGSSIMEGFSSLNAILSNLIKSWDVYADDEQTEMYPVDPDSLSSLPVAFRMSVLFGIMKDIRPEVLAAQMQN